MAAGKAVAKGSRKGTGSGGTGSGSGSAKTGLLSRTNPLFLLLAAVFAILCVAIIGRLFYLQVLKADEYRQEAGITRLWTIQTAAARGTIYDRTGHVLAISVPATTIIANPQEITDVDFTASVLSEALGVDKETLVERFEWGQENESQFAYVKRGATLQEGTAVREIGLAGIYFLDDTRREYPYGEVGGQIVGLCDADGKGVCGLELYYDDVLRGTNGTYVAEMGESGLPIPGGLVQDTPAVNGQDIMITIDIELQYELEYALKRASISENGAKMSSIVMDGSNGEILAIASLPLFNPADTSEVEEGATTLWPVSIAYEPGSTFKTVSATSLLDHDKAEPTTQIYCPVELEANDRIIKDSDERGEMIMDLNRIIAVSSNVGISRMVQEYLGFYALYRDIQRYGFTLETGVDFPGETAGYLDDYADWTTVQAYNVCFGQGISVSGMQLVRFYGALANGGVANTPHFLLTNVTTGVDATFPAEQILLRDDTAEEVTGVLRHVVTEGTSWMAAIPDYYVVGKSGTGEIFQGVRYRTDVYNRSFIGYLDEASTPLVCYVCAQEVPYEGSVAPSTFRTIMRAAIERYRVTSSWDGTETTVPGYERAL